MKLIQVASTTAFVLLTAFAPALSAATIFGGYDCGQWTKRKPNHPMEAWVTGYLSGLSVMHAQAQRQPPDPLDRLNSIDQAFVWLDNFCKANPLRRLDGATVELFDELINRAR